MICADHLLVVGVIELRGMSWAEHVACMPTTGEKYIHICIRKF